MKSILIFLLTFMFFPANSIFPQDDLIKNILKKVDDINKTLLRITELSDEEENKIGEELYKKITDELKPAKERKFKIKQIFDRIKSKAERKKIKYSYGIFEDTTINAFALAGGKTIILTGLIDFLDTEDQMAFVIAHEIAHNELKHCIRKIQYAVQASKINPMFGEVVRIAYNVYSRPYSQQEELEADSVGVELMVNAGYKIDGAISFFEKLKELEGINKRLEIEPINDFIYTHPMAEKRKQRILEIKDRKRK